MCHFSRSLFGRFIALLLCGQLGPLACIPAEILDPVSGAPAYQVPGLVAVPGGFVNAAGGNLALMREEISIDTPLGTQSIVSVYNSATESWQWSHQISYDGTTFVDAMGAVHDLSSIADGAPLPGTIWDRVDADTLRTRGGLDHHFRPDGSLEQVHWATLDYPRITYASDAISQCTGPLACAPIFWITSNETGAPISITDARTAREALFEYDASGHLTTAWSPFDVSEGRPGARYEYAPWSTRVSAVVDSDGTRVEYAYRAGGQIGSVTQIGEGDPTHVFRYLGRTRFDRYPTLHTNPLGGVTRYAFDAQRRLARVDRMAVSEVTGLEWEGMRPVRMVDPGGVESRFSYENDRLSSRIQPSGNVVSYSYAADALNMEMPESPAVERIEDSLGVVEERDYDAFGRPVEITIGGLETTTLDYAGASLDTIEQQGIEVRFPIFGMHGHWLEATAGGEVVARRVFDAVGNVAVSVARNSEGGVLSRSYDADRRLAALELAESDEAGHVGNSSFVSIARRSDGRLTEIERPEGADHRIDYDALGRPAAVHERVDGIWRTESFEHDAAGNQTARERPNGMRDEYEYDAFGRMVRHRALRDGSLEGEAEFTWLSGKLVARYDSVRGTTEVYSYDSAGRLASTAFGYGETIARTYDLRGRCVGETFTIPGVGTVAEPGWDYDLADRPVRLVDRSTGEVLAEDRLEGGLPVESETANGLRRVYLYDDEGRIREMETFDAAGASVETSTIDRTALAGPPRLEIAKRTATSLAVSEERYWLPLGSSLAVPDQRIGKRLFGWNDGVGSGAAFAWDALSNSADTMAGDQFVYNAERSRLQLATFNSGESVAYVYDAAGFVTERDGVSLSWTANGRLASYGPDVLVWDMAGRLMEMTQGGVKREFVLFGGRIESSLTTLGALDLGAVSIDLVTGERRYRYPDFRGNVSFVADETGTVSAQFRYGPFGVDAVWGQAGASIAFERRPGFGPFVLLGARVLDPLIGRFLSPDPILQLHNQYAYALGNPLWFQDRNGREMDPRNAVQVGLLVTQVAVAGAVVATVLATGTIAGPALAAAGIALALTNIVVSVSLQIDSALGASRPPQVTAPSAAPEPLPEPDGDDGAPAPQIKVLVLEAGTVPSCTPLAPLRGAGTPPWLPMVLVLINLTLAVVWWQRRRKEVA